MCLHEFVVVNCINLILYCDTTKLKNFSTPHGEMLDPPLDYCTYVRVHVHDIVRLLLITNGNYLHVVPYHS